MSLQRRTSEAFKLLGVEQLPEEWVGRCWEENFCESCPLPSQVCEGVLSVRTWREVADVCREWLSAAANGVAANQDSDEAEETVGPGLWTTLVDCGVSHRALLALIFSVLDRKSESVDEVGCSVCATQTYLYLLRLPGSTAFKTFQPIIFQKALSVVYVLSGTKAGLGGSGGKGREGGRRGRRGEGGRKGRKRRRRGDVEGGEGEEEGEEGEGSTVLEESALDVMSQGSEREKTSLLTQLTGDVLELTVACPSLSVGETGARDQLVQVALHLLTQHTSGTTLTPHMLVSHSHKGATGVTGSQIEVVAWRILAALALGQRREIMKSVTEIFVQLLPILLMLKGDGSAHSSTSSLPPFLTTPSNNATIFICHLVAECGEPILVPLKGLIQQLCTKTPDRAEYRTKMANTVCKLLSLFPDQFYSQLLEWLSRLARNIKVSNRVFAVEVVSELLTHPLRQPKDGSLSGEEEYRLSYKYLIKMALSRCSDKAPSVRGRALICVAAAASSERSEVVSALKKCLTAQTATDPLVAPEKEPVESLIVPMVRRRTTDQKVGVRKNALQALEAIIRLDLTNINREDVLALHERCMDTALSVRKQALVSLSSLVSDLPHCATLHELWLDGVLPMVMDKEASAQEKVISTLESIILNNIAPLHTQQQAEGHRFVWDLLSLVAEEDRMDLRRYVCRAMELWAKQGKLGGALVRAVCSHTSHPPHQRAAWTLLAEMSQYVASSLDTNFVYDNWRLHSSAVSMEMTVPLVQILTVIGNAAKSLAKVAREDMRDEIVSMLETFSISPVVIQAAITTLSQICESLTRSRESYQTAVDNWCVPLLKKCELYLTSLIDDNSQSSVSEGGREIDEKEATCYLFAVGELCRLSPVHTSSHLTLMVHSLLLATREGDGEKPSFRSLSSQSSQLSGLTNLSFSPSLRALTYLTLGKLCLQDEELTKQVIPQLVRELQTSPHSATRNNVVVVLCDLAVRYSVKVDPHIPAIAVCLRDDSLLVRRQTLTLLASLIQEDYIKWKGALFFRFISTLLDEELRVFSEFCLVHILLARNPNMFSQHFVECVFHFNGYEKHRVYNRFKQTERERELFSLKGSKHRDQRMKLYTFLLSHMTDPHRFQLTAKLCQEVLGGVVDKVIQLDNSSVPVIQDTLAILTSKEIKLSSLRRNMGEELADEGDHIGAIAAIAQTKIISQIVKKNVIENFIPIVIAAKHLFEKEHSPLLRDLLLCLKEMMTDFRSEITEILAADKQLAEEIKFDLKRVEEEQRRAARAPNTPLPDTPHAQIVSPLLTPGQAGMTPRSVLTPPRLRATPTGNTGKSKGAIVTAKTPRIAALKTPLPRIASPLLSHRAAVPPSQTQLPPSTRAGKAGVLTPVRKPPPQSSGDRKAGGEGVNQQAQEEGGKGRKEREDVTTPAAARARASLVNTSYVPELMTPLFTKTPRVSLHRESVPLSSKKPTTTPHGTKGLRSDETVLHGRVASTPEGLAESISFNVSSIVPPSPIPATSNPNCYLSRRSDRLRGRTKKASTNPQTADILMLPPEQEPRKLDKWRIRPK